MLEHEVRVEQDRLDLRQQRIVLVDVAPPRLHHPDPGISEMRQRALEEIGRGDEVRVEDGHELAGRLPEARLERSRLVAAPVDPVQVADVDASGRVTAHGRLRNCLGLVGRVIQDLNLEQLPRVVHLADGVDQPVRDVHLVEDRKLDGDARQDVESRQLGGRSLALVFHVKINKVVPMPAVDCQNAEDKEIQDEDQCLRQAHKKMNPSRRTIGDFIALQNWKSTRVKHLEARDRLRSA